MNMAIAKIVELDLEVIKLKLRLKFGVDILKKKSGKRKRIRQTDGRTDKRTDGLSGTL